MCVLDFGIKTRTINLKNLGIDVREKWGPCHHGMARPQVMDGGTAFDMEGSCEYIE
jgi:hypothetical protein